MQTHAKTARASAAESAAVPQPAAAHDAVLDIAAPPRHSFARVTVTAAPRGAIQPKLTVGAASDKYEDEADRVAGQVMRMTDAQVQRLTPEDEEDTIQAKPDVQRQAEGSFDAGAAVESRVAARRGGGSPLPKATRAFMEPRFGADFSRVRVHADAEADRLSQDLSARAFTTGRDIYFRQGEYRPASSGGQALLAHELAHVVQQGRDAVLPLRAFNKFSNTVLAAGVIQRIKVNPIGNKDLLTPGQAIADALGLSVKDLELPGQQPAKTRARPHIVKATIDKLREEGRQPSGILSTVTAMARAEQYILQGVDPKGSYDAGHLVADQFFDEGDSFQYWNLAPQISEFNSDVYANVMEKPIREQVKEGDEVSVLVEVKYPKDGMYKISLRHLVNRGIILEKDIKGKDIDEMIEIHRRIPEKWTITVSTKGNNTFDQDAYNRHRGYKSYKESVKGSEPNLGERYIFTTSSRKYNPDKVKNKYRNSLSGPRLKGRQWTPSDEGVRGIDVSSLVSEYFPDLSNIKERILQLIDDIKRSSDSHALDSASQSVLSELKTDLTACVGKLAYVAEILEESSASQIEQSIFGNNPVDNMDSQSTEPMFNVTMSQPIPAEEKPDNMNMVQ